MTLGNCDIKVTDFLRWKSIECGFSSKSLDAYRADLGGFLSYISQNKKNDLLRLNLEDIDDYIVFLTENDYKKSAISRKISTIRQFYKYLYLNGIIKENPARNLRAPKKENAVIKPITIDEVQQLIDATDQFVFPHNLRLRVLIEIAFGAGLRVSELVTLPLESFNHDRDYAIIVGKGNKERLIPITNMMKKAIKDYLPYRLFFSNGVAGTYLFLSTGREGHLTRVRFFQLLKELAIFANIDPALLSPHVFRHSFALSLLRGGADLKSLQSLLGHEKIDTVEIYTKINQDDILNMVKNHHPLVKA